MILRLPTAKSVVIRIMDSTYKTKWMLRIPTDRLPANANAAYPLKLSITTEWDNDIHTLPERQDILVDLPAWGNPYV